MRAWEREYERYNSAETLNEFNELKKKVEDNKCSKEELKEYNKMKRIYGYLPQVENLKEAIDVLNKRMELLKAETEIRKQMEENEKLEAEIEEERKSYIESGEEDFEKLVELQDKELELNKNKKDLESKSRDPEILGMTSQELEVEILATKEQRSRCHVAAGCFMEGYSRDSIDLRVNKNWENRKFTTKEPLTSVKNAKKNEKVTEKATKEVAEAIAEDQTVPLNPVDGATKQDGEPEIAGNENGMIYVEKIKKDVAKAHPWLTRFSDLKLPFLGKRAEAKLDEYVRMEADRIDRVSQSGEMTPGGETTPEERQTASEEFKAKYEVANWNVMDIAEKGIDGLEKEAKAEKLEAAKERYAAMQEKAQHPDRYKKVDGKKIDTFAELPDKEDDGEEIGD